MRSLKLTVAAVLLLVVVCSPSGLRGKSLMDAKSITNAQIADELALPPVKIHCSVLAEDAIKAAVSNYEEKRKTS